jgi:hypothetical protein
VQCTFMGKKPFTTRIDEAVMELAQRMADAERRSVTALIEIAVIEYAERRGEALTVGAAKTPTPARRSVGPEDEDRAGPEAPE